MGDFFFCCAKRERDEEDTKDADGHTAKEKAAIEEEEKLHPGSHAGHGGHNHHAGDDHAAGSGHDHSPTEKEKKEKQVTLLQKIGMNACCGCEPVPQDHKSLPTSPTAQNGSANGSAIHKEEKELEKKALELKEAEKKAVEKKALELKEMAKKEEEKKALELKEAAKKEEEKATEKAKQLAEQTALELKEAEAKEADKLKKLAEKQLDQPEEEPAEKPVEKPTEKPEAKSPEKQPEEVKAPEQEAPKSPSSKASTPAKVTFAEKPDSPVKEATA